MENLLLSALSSLSLARWEGFVSGTSLSPMRGIFSVHPSFSVSVVHTIHPSEGFLCLVSRSALLGNPSGGKLVYPQNFLNIFQDVTLSSWCLTSCCMRPSTMGMTNPGSTPGTMDQYVDFNKIPMGFKCTLMSEKHDFRQQRDHAILCDLPKATLQLVLSRHFRDERTRVQKAYLIRSVSSICNEQQR